MYNFTNDENQPTAPVSNGVDWAKAHPYTAASIVAGALLVMGALIVGERASRPQTSGIQAWGGTDLSFVNSTSFSPNAPIVSTNPNLLNTQAEPDFTSIPYTQNSDLDTPTNEGFSLGDLLALISKPSNSSNSADSGTPDLRGAYAFVPQGLISTTTPGPTRTGTQQKLYQYGNDVGSYISTYEDSHKNAGQVLTDQVQDRQNQSKAQAVKDIGAALASVGRNLQSMDEVPSIVAPVHTALAKSYIDMGAKLALVPDAESDQGYISAIEAYNAAADSFAKQYVALANIFVGTRVVFSPEDPGSVFSFNVGGGL